MNRFYFTKRFEEFQKFDFKFDLGIGQLLKEWKLLFIKDHLKEDFFAGLTVSAVAVPLSLAIAMASGVPPATGLITAIIASIVCGLFGGTQLAVSGPAAAIAIIVADIVEKYGMSNLLVVGLICGVLQVLAGVLRLGGLVRFVPLPVLVGFTAGVGAVVFIGQLPLALGLPAPDQAHVFAVAIHIWDLLHKANVTELTLASMTIFATFSLPRFSPKLPSTLIAVAVPTFLAFALGLDTKTIASISALIPMPHLPLFSSDHTGGILWAGIIVFALTSLESLLSSSAVDKVSKDRHDPDQELIGQGLGNIVLSIFGGMPATGVIARSTLNVRAGAKTRRASVFHGIILTGVLLFFAPIFEKIPLSVLAGVILSVAIRMLRPRELVQLWNTSSFDGLIYLVTFATTVFVDLIVGVQAGLVVALIIAAIRIGKIHTHIYNSTGSGPIVVSLDGAVSFLSSSKLESIRKEIIANNRAAGVVFDFSKVDSLDVSGAGLLVDLFQFLEAREIIFAVKGLSEKFHNIFLSNGLSGVLQKHLALRESDVFSILGGVSGDSNLDRLVYGVERFRKELSESYLHIFRKLEKNQQPHTLFISCSDSRINPNLMTATDPGELFIIRNVGNIIPTFGNDATPAEGAALEFALIVLGVKDVVVCGHSECGAMKYMLNSNVLSVEQSLKTPSLTKWMMQVGHLKKNTTSQTSSRHAAELNVLLQIENLKTYPVVQERLAAGNLRIRAWYYDIGKSELEEWDERRKMFVRMGEAESYSERRLESRVQFQQPASQCM